MTFSKFKYVFLVFGCIYLIDGLLTLFYTPEKHYAFFWFSISKNQELFRQFTMASIFLFSYWRQIKK